MPTPSHKQVALVGDTPAAPARVTPRLLALVGCALALGTGCGGEGSSPPPDAEQQGDPGPFRSIAIDVKVDPAGAGTEQDPQGVRLDLRLRLGQPRGAEPPLLKTAEIRFPEGTRYSGGSFPSCSQATLERAGPERCPRGAIMGSGTATMMVDVAHSRARITVVNGGADRLFFYTQMDQPARVHAPIVGTLSDDRTPWAYRLRLAVPRDLQLVAGVPVALRELHASAGSGDWLATTSCPEDGSWEFEGTARFGDGGSAAQTATVACEG